MSPVQSAGPPEPGDARAPREQAHEPDVPPPGPPEPGDARSLRGNTKISPGFTLPLRRWLALALAFTFFVPALVTATVAWGQWHGSGESWSAQYRAMQLLRAGAARWDDPAWQSATRAALAPQGVDFVLFEDGREVYRSAADPLAGAEDGRQR